MSRISLSDIEVYYGVEVDEFVVTECRNIGVWSNKRPDNAKISKAKDRCIIMWFCHQGWTQCLKSSIVKINLCSTVFLCLFHVELLEFCIKMFLNFFLSSLYFKGIPIKSSMTELFIGLSRMSVCPDLSNVLFTDILCYLVENDTQNSNHCAPVCSYHKMFAHHWWYWKTIICHDNLMHLIMHMHWNEIMLFL